MKECRRFVSENGQEYATKEEALYYDSIVARDRKEAARGKIVRDRCATAIYAILKEEGCVHDGYVETWWLPEERDIDRLFKSGEGREAR